MNSGILKTMVVGLAEMVTFVFFLGSLFAVVIVVDALINPGVMQ